MKSTDIIKPTPLIAPIANEGLKTSIPDSATGSNYASIEEGFPEITMKAPADGGLPPWGQDFNGMFYLMSSQTCFLQNGGQITFDQNVSNKIGGYPEGAILDYIDENQAYSKVKSLIDDNTYNFVTTPSYIDGVHWEKISLSASSSWGNITGDIENQTDLQAELATRLNTSQVTNCILANNGAEITTQSYEGAAYVNNGCTVSEAGVASGFGANNFILLNKTMTDANAFVMTIPFKVNSTGGIQPLAAISNQDNCIQLDNGVLALKYNGLELKGAVTVSAATQYYAVLTRTKTGYTLELKNSFEEAAEALDTINLTSTAGYFGGKPIYLGVDKSGNFLNGEIDLAQLTITAGGEAYWSNATTLDFETVTLSGSLQVLMPNGRNADQTLKNVEQTITLNDVLLFNNATGSAKTVLVKQDGEVMIRDFYSESSAQPDVPLNGVWFDTDNNVMNTQLNTYPNFINTGVTVENGIVSGFSAEDYLQLPEQYNLGGNWNISLAVTPASTEPTEPTAPTDATSDTTPTEPTEATPCGLLGNIEVSGEDYIPDGVGLIYDGAGNVTAVFRRADVYNVRKTVVLSTAYEVQKGTGETAEYGYVQTAGDEESYVAADTQVYADSRFSTPLETAAADTWQYTGETQENTQTLNGYTKTAGSTLVSAETVIYSDANCTSVQGTASGTDYVYTGATSVSIIGTLTDTVTAGQENSVVLSYDGANYKLNQKTLASTDDIRNTITISLGKALSTGGYFTGTINLNNSAFSFWTWNGVGEAIADLVPFVGVKIGEVMVNSEITNPNINIEGTLTNNNGLFSGFNSTNTLNIPEKFQPDINPWKMVFKITTGSDISTSQRIAQISSYGIHLGVMSSKFRLWLSTNGSSWDLANDTTGTYTVLTNTEYYVQVIYTGSAYTLSYSLTGEPETFTQDISISSSTPLNFSNGYPNIGGNTSPWLGSINLNESYININGEQWWKWNGLLENKSTYSIGSINLNFPLNIASKYDIKELENKKADKDLSNTVPSQSFKDMSIGWGMPDYDSAISIPSYPYTAPSDGFVAFVGHSGNSTTNIYVNGQWVGRGNISIFGNRGYGASSSSQIFVSQGDIITATTESGVISYGQLNAFMPLKGVSNA